MKLLFCFKSYFVKLTYLLVVYKCISLWFCCVFFKIKAWVYKIEYISNDHPGLLVGTKATLGSTGVYKVPTNRT